MDQSESKLLFAVGVTALTFLIIVIFGAILLKAHIKISDIVLGLTIVILIIGLIILPALLSFSLAWVIILR